MNGPGEHPLFRRCLELAWQSYVEGGIGIGAVVADPDGDVVAEGRNRVGVEPDGSEPIEGTILAHAEMHAVAKLPRRDGGYADHVLWTSLDDAMASMADTLAALPSQPGAL